MKLFSAFVISGQINVIRTQVIGGKVNSAACNLDHETWVDSRGTSCQDYFDDNWCSADGLNQQIISLSNSGNLNALEDYANLGFDALNCPQCGCIDDPEEDKCILITESHVDDASDGLYRKKSLGLWGNEDGTKVLVYQSSNGGWAGCNAVNYVPNCNFRSNWGYMPDLIVPIDFNVNIKRGTGNSSGKTTQCAVSCPVSWTLINGTCVKVFCDNPMTWYGAREACSMQNAFLSPINDEETNEIIANEHSGQLWIGRSDEKIEGNWTTVFGEVLHWINWDLKGPQPDNKNGNEDCLMMNWNTAGQWADFPCNYLQDCFACQKADEGCPAGLVFTNGKCQQAPLALIPPPPPPVLQATSAPRPSVAFNAPLATTPIPVKLNWGGQSVTDPCGSMVEIDESLINSTCTITYNFGPVPNIYRMFVGSGAFIVPDGIDRKITGYEGISSENMVDIVAFWQMTEDANQNLINDTCGDASFFDLDCEPTIDGNALPGVFFMETINDARMGKGSRYGFQIGGAAVGQILNIQLKDALGNPFECNNFNGNAGDVQLSSAPNCTPVLMPTGLTQINCANGAITLDLSDSSAKYFAGGLVTFSCTQSMNQAAEPDLWQSSISTF